MKYQKLVFRDFNKHLNEGVVIDVEMISGLFVTSQRGHFQSSVCFSGQ